MRTRIGLLISGLILIATTTALAAQTAPACKVTLYLGDKPTRTLAIEPDKLSTDGNQLVRLGEVYIGFLNDQQTRLKLTEDSVQGNLGPAQVMLTLHREPKAKPGPGRLLLRGTIGGQRVNATVTRELITLANRQLELKLALQHASTPRTQRTFKDHMGAFRLTLEGCTEQALQDRPEALLALHQIVLQRALEQYKTP